MEKAIKNNRNQYLTTGKSREKSKKMMLKYFVKALDENEI